MTEKEKQNKLDRLDELLLNQMIKIMESGKTEGLSDLATVSNYLAKNNRVAEKKKSSTEDEVKDRVKAARERREKDNK